MLSGAMTSLLVLPSNGVTLDVFYYRTIKGLEAEYLLRKAWEQGCFFKHSLALTHQPLLISPYLSAI